MYTEEEAKKKWCPMSHKRLSVVFTPDQQQRAEQYIESDTRMNCIASECAMWRWCNVEYSIKPTRGFCGLRGKP